MIAAANEIVGKPYKYGGGHGDWEDSGYDCSGSESYALHGAGLVSRPLNSTEFMSWGEAGRRAVDHQLCQQRALIPRGRRPAFRHRLQQSGQRAALEREDAPGGRLHRSATPRRPPASSTRDREPPGALPTTARWRRRHSPRKKSEISRPMIPTTIRMIADGGDLDARNVGVDGEVEDRPDGDQEK